MAQTMMQSVAVFIILASLISLHLNLEMLNSNHEQFDGIECDAP